MKFPITINRGHKWSRQGYEFLWQRGSIRFRSERTSAGIVSRSDTSGVKFQVWIATWVCHLAELPERTWRHVLARLWLDRLSFQYESGFAAGLREGINNREYYDQLTPAELEAVMAPPQASQQIK